MSAIIKGVAGVGIPAAGAGGAYVLLKNSNKIEDMPEFHSLQTSSSGKYVNDYKPYFANNTEDKNKDWWDWSYKYKFPKNTEEKNKLSTEFQNINSGNDLKSKCTEAYDKATGDFPPTKNEDNARKYLDDLWKFCSIFSSKPKTISDNSETEGADKKALNEGGGYKSRYGETKKDELVSVNYVGLENDRFWELREEEFFGKEGTQGKGQYTDPGEGKKTIFHELYDKKTQRPKNGLKSTCGKAYGLDTTSSESSTPPKPTQEDIVNFCGLKVKST